MKKKFLHWLACKLKAEDIVYLICRYMLVNDSPELKFSYTGIKRINGCVIRSKGSLNRASFGMPDIPYAGDEKT